MAVDVEAFALVKARIEYLENQIKEYEEKLNTFHEDLLDAFIEQREILTGA